MKIHYKLITLISFFAFVFFLNFKLSSAQQGSAYYGGQIYNNNQVSNTQNIQKYPELCTILSRTLQRGDQGDDVFQLQLALSKEGLGTINASGYYGQATISLVKAFQLQAGIYTVGKVGPQTLNRIKNIWCGANNIYTRNNWTTPTVNTGNNAPLSVSISPTTSSGNNITIGWNTQNAQSCVLNGQSVQVNSTQTFTVSSETSFTISCSDYLGNKVSKIITVQPNQIGSAYNYPTVNLSINPSYATVGQTATLYWTSQNTQYCTYNGAQVSSNGSQQIVVQSGNITYNIICTNSIGQTATGSVNATNGGTNNNISTISQNGNTIIVSFPTTTGTINWGDGIVENLNTIQCFAAPCNLTQTHSYVSVGNFIVSVYGVNNAKLYALNVNLSGNGSGNNTSTLNIVPTTVTINSGQSTTLSIYSNYTNSCVIFGGIYTLVSGSPSGVNFNGSILINPATTTAYTVSCVGTNGQNVSQTAYVTVGGSGYSGGNIGLISTISNSNKNLNIQIRTDNNYACVSGNVDWGDGQSTAYTPSSGSACLTTATHTYNYSGNYTLKTFTTSSGTYTQLDTKTIYVQ